MNLTQPDHTLALVTSTTSDIDYTVSYTLNTKTGEVYESSSGSITTATTTEIVSGPLLEKQKLITLITIKNIGVSTNSVLLKRVHTAGDFEIGQTYSLEAGGVIVWKDGAFDETSLLSHVTYRDTLVDLKATPTTLGSVYVKGRLTDQDGYEGHFQYRTGDYSTEVTTDTTEAIHVKADGIATTVGAWVRDYSGAISPRWYGVTFDGTTNDSAAWQACFDARLPIEDMKGGSTVITTGLTAYSTGDPPFNQGLQLKMAGTELCTFINKVSSVPMIDVDVDTVGEFLLGCELHGFRVIKGGSPTNQIGIQFKTTYNLDLSQIHIDGLNGDGLKFPTVLGDLDASSMPKLQHVRIENCTGWGINAKGDSGKNELSNFNMNEVFIQGCGTNEYKAVTGITNANPSVVTATAHGFANGLKIKLFAVGGMVEVNENTYTVANQTANTYELSGVDSTTFGTYTSGGEAAPAIPLSGGINWKGQILKMDNSALVNNNNVALFIPGEAGLAQNVDLRSVVFENNYKRGLLTTGVKDFIGSNLQFYSNDTFKTYVLAEFNGDDATIRNVNISSAIVRSTSGNTNQTAFKLTGANIEPEKCRIGDIDWVSYDFSGQVRYKGWKDKPSVIVHKTSAQNVLNSVSAVGFDVKNSDIQDCFNTTTNRFTIPYQGIFNLKGHITITSMDANVAVTIDLYDVSNAVNLATVIHNADGVTTQSFPFDFTSLLGALGLDRSYEIRASQQSVANKALDVSNVGYNVLSIKRVELQD